MIWTILWLLWGVFFGVVEGAALVAQRRGNWGGTLSEHVWKWAAVKGYRWPHLIHLRRVAMLLFMAELTVHFASGRWWF